jgi:hypothetical protein
MLAYHFISSDFVTRFNPQQTGVGHTLSVEGDLKLCNNGLHASVHPLDAASYAAEGQTTLCLVELTEVVKDERKVCGRTRKILKAFDATKLLQEFAIWCAEETLHIFEDRFPNDDRPRLAIEAAKIVTENPTEKNKSAADAAAYAAAYAAGNAAYAAAGGNKQKYRDEFKRLVDEAFNKMGE